MNFKTQFKKSFSYTWYLYLLAIVLPSIIFPLSFSFMHRAQEYQTLSLFVSCDDYSDKMSSKIKKDLSIDGLKKVEIISSDPYDNEFNYYQKLTVIGYNRCDILILPEDKIERARIYTASIELNDEVKTLCGISDESFYSYEEKPYGVEIPKTSPISSEISVAEDKKYYAFLNGNSWNIGSYSSQPKTTNNAFELMKYILGK